MNNEQEDDGRDSRGGDLRGGDGGGRKRRRSGGSTEETRSTGDIYSASTSNYNIESTSEQGATGISERIPEHAGNGGRSTSRVRKLPAWFGQSNQTMAELYEKGFEERANRVFRELQRSDGQLVRDIFRFNDDGEVETFLNVIQRDERYNRGLLQVCRENTHVHVAHDCSYSNSTCRCNWYQKATTFGFRRDRRGSRRHSCRSRTLSDIQNLLIYYTTKGRTIVYQKIGGHVERLPSEGYNIPEGRYDELRKVWKQMGDEVPRDGSELQLSRYHIDDDEPDVRHRVQESRPKKRKVGAQERIQLKVIEVLKKNPITPPEAIVQHAVWREDPDLKFKTACDKEIKAAIDVYKNELCPLTIQQFYEMYNEPDCTPIFSAGITKFDDYYYNIENSVKILDEMVRFQNNDDDDCCLYFVKSLFEVLERKIPKFNTLVIHSHPNSGKNYFFDAIMNFYINRGTMNNPNKNSQFAYQDVASRRVIIWNEPNYSHDHIEKLKMILGGDCCTVNVKFSADRPMYRTPVIVMTNNVVSFMTHPAFLNCRLKVFEWGEAPWLLEHKKYPNPLATPHLFRKYGLM